MNERLLQFIWQFQYYNKNDLRTATGETVQVIDPGRYNTNQGPDFLDAKLKIDDTVWAGSVELHIRTGDWKRHGHDDDGNYRNVILHVVWKDEEQISQPANSIIRMPVLELAPRISKLLLDRYEQLMNLEDFIPCQSSASQVGDITWQAWKDRLLVERMMRRATAVEELLRKNNFHWEETSWWLLARNFGSWVNMDAFEAMARSIPFSVIGRQKEQIIQLEALMMGQAGLLNGRYKESYPRLLQKEYRYQRIKHRLRPILMPVHFLRMRPGNFPTIRLAQLAMLLHNTDHLFSMIRETEDLGSVYKKFNVAANDYWHYHYRFDEESSFRIKKLGASMIDNLIMNTAVPLLFSYGQYYNEQAYKERAISWLEQVRAEENRVTKAFEISGIKMRNGADSQALLELKSEYCDTRRCLDCAVGNSLLKSIGPATNPPPQTDS